ncbi:MAG: trypsin-like peptidase domain-containing protein [Phycisphaerales bacterium]|nr:trypsin-like peptidase domain-containing protein [Phycisphaerales bacterium]
MQAKHHRQKRTQRGAAAGTLLLVVVVGFLLWWFRPWEHFAPEAPKPDAVPRVVAARGALAEDEQNNIAVFKAVSPSVVHITTLAAQRSFFSTDITQVPRGTGSGFMWDEAGHIVTNFHVIQGASGAQVTLQDQSTWNASLVGAFPDRDLAVLRIAPPKDRIKPIVIGVSKDLQVGQKVYAIGNPFGLDQSLTTGIVSALNREIESVTQRTIRGVIQTDAAINPGNSGGPLIDSAGRLIGVNTAIYSPSGASAGIGFAIPVDEVNRIVPRLIRDGKFIRPAIGIQAAPPTLQQALKLPEGVAVAGVLPNSPAEKIGLRPFMRARDGNIVLGDIIVELDGKSVKTIDDLLSALEQHQPGDTVSIKVARGGETVEEKIVLGLSE